jgi:S1-C subfamily serine protease
VRVGEVEVTDADTLAAALEATVPGADVVVQLVRGAEEHSVTVRLPD